jgi:uncharacterized protein Yka (UPF0111/DUF47 family)
MNRLRNLLPADPDILGSLERQARTTGEGIDALLAWARHEAGADLRVRDVEHQADAIKWEVRLALREAFVTPIDAEDLYVLSTTLDEVMNQAKDAVREAEALRFIPDKATESMVERLVEGFGALVGACAELRQTKKIAGAAELAEAARKAERRLERVYRAAMSDLVDSEVEVRDFMIKREMYRRFARMGEAMTDVSERFWYASMKEV